MLIFFFEYTENYIRYRLKFIELFPSNLRE